MTPSPITDKTRTLGKPRDWNDSKGSCESLDIFDYNTDNGSFMLSAWSPEPEELSALNNGGFVFLHIRAHDAEKSHPVVAITVSE